MAFAIYDRERGRYLTVGDLMPLSADGIVARAVACWDGDALATAALRKFAAANKRDSFYLNLQKVRFRVFPVGEESLREKFKRLCVASGRTRTFPCDLCGKAVSWMKYEMMHRDKENLKAPVIENGTKAVRQACCLTCQRKAITRFERTVECLDKEMSALRNGKELLKAMAIHCTKKLREASQLQGTESEPDTNLLNSCRPSCPT